MSALRLLLNSPYTGANIFFALGVADDSFRAAGLDLQLTPGRGAWTAAGRLARGEFDLAYGDLNALVNLAALDPQAELPKAICVLHQNTPSVITVRLGSPIRTARDLTGKRLLGHASDVALQTFPIFALANGVAPESVSVQTSDLGMADLLGEMLAGRHDAAFGYATTHTAALASRSLAAADTVRFLRFRDACPSLYGSALMASPRLLRTQPAVLRGVVQVLLAKVADARARPEAALDALESLAAGTDRVIERARWQATMDDDMALGNIPRAQWGGYDAVRLAEGIEGLARACQWPSAPESARVATRDFLP